MRMLLIFLALTVSLSASLWGQPALPDSPARTVFNAWLQAFNAGDRTAVAAYLEKYEPKHKERLEMMLGFQARTGGFDLVKIESAEGLHLEALVKERSGGNFAQVSLELTDATSLEVKNMGVRLVPPPSDANNGTRPGPSVATRMSQADAIKALDAKAATLAGQDNFSGAILVAANGAIALEKAYGKADRDRNQPNTLDTKFRLGSMNKMFTAAAVLQLVGQGKVDLAAPIGKYLRDYPNADLASKVTVRHLLTHTGGTGDIFMPEYEQRRQTVRDPNDYIQLFGSRALAFQPGSKWEYSNYGFILLGAIVERVAGVSYYDYVRKNIFIPSGMTFTDSLPEAAVASKLSKGYMRNSSGWTTNAETLPARGTPAGGGYSTVRDMHRFASALLAGKLVKPELLKEMTTKQSSSPQMPPGGAYGFGMVISENPRRFGHGGGAPGMNGELRIYPDTQTIVVVLANLDPPVATQLTDTYEQIMPLQ